MTQQLGGRGGLCRGESRDKVVSLCRPHPSASVRLAVQLTLDEEVAHLLEVDVAVRADEAARVAVLVPSLHHRPAAGHTHTHTGRQEVLLLDYVLYYFHGQFYNCTCMLLLVHTLHIILCLCCVLVNCMTFQIILLSHLHIYIH